MVYYEQCCISWVSIALYLDHGSFIRWLIRIRRARECQQGKRVISLVHFTVVVDAIKSLREIELQVSIHAGAWYPDLSSNERTMI